MMEGAATSVGAKVSTVAAYAASGGSFFLGLSPDWWNVIIGGVGVLGSWAIMIYFRRRDSRRMEEWMKHGRDGRAQG